MVQKFGTKAYIHICVLLAYQVVKDRNIHLDLNFSDNLETVISHIFLCEPS